MWGPSLLKRYMRWRLNTAAPGADLGAYAHTLPASKNGNPAPLPTALLEWEATHGIVEPDAGGAPHEEDTSNDKAIESKTIDELYNSTDEYTLEDNIVTHSPSGHQVPLEPGTYKHYKSDNGIWCVWNGQSAPEYAFEIFLQAAAVEISGSGGAQSAGRKAENPETTTCGTSAMKGMTPGPGHSVQHTG